MGVLETTWETSDSIHALGAMRDRLTRQKRTKRFGFKLSNLAKRMPRRSFGSTRIAMQVLVRCDTPSLILGVVDETVKNEPMFP